MIPSVRAVRSYGLAFLGFGIPTGLIAGLGAGFWLGSATAGLLVGLVGCGVMGGAFAMVIGTLDVVADRDGRHGGPADRGRKPASPSRPVMTCLTEFNRPCSS
jgi:hypothetical protein